MADCWDAFGSDDDDESDNTEDPAAGTLADSTTPQDLKAASEISLYLVKTFLHANSQISVAQRRVGLVQLPVLSDNQNQDNETNDDDNDIQVQVWQDALKERGFSPVSVLKFSNEKASTDSSADPILHDALIVLSGDNDQSIVWEHQQIYRSLVKGGILLVVVSTTGIENEQQTAPDPTKWMASSADGIIGLDNGSSNSDPVMVYTDDNRQVLALQKRLCRIQDKSCRWLSSKHSVAHERTRALEATIPVTAHECHTSQLTSLSMERAVQRMQQYGYCILPSLLDATECLQWGHAVLNDLHQASQLLLQQEGVDIYHPHSSQKDPQSYRELSMREDLRMDLRDGPQLQKLRGGNNKPIVVKAANNNKDNPPTTNNENPFFRRHPSILEIVQRTMNPQKGTLYKGNFGRHNFEGSGPDGSYQDMRLSAIGGIVSLPGSADQALHADAPHLFETMTLPAHYINAFTMGCNSGELVGCTAFVHGSHQIEFTARYMADEEDNQVFDFLVRPQLELGDVVLFDCRTLHFGLGNQSQTVERPLLYCNMTHAWFHDPKNWDNHHPIFPSSDDYQ